MPRASAARVVVLAPGPLSEASPARALLLRCAASRGVEAAWTVVSVLALLALVWLLAFGMPRLLAPVEERPLPSQGCPGLSCTGATSSPVDWRKP
jgi:hypothetical protein